MQTIVPISVIIPCYNVSEFIEKTIKSVLIAAYIPDEIICVNDCSTDSTLDKIQNLASTHKEILVLNNQKNIGAFTSRKLAVKHSKNSLILLLDGDDFLDLHSIEYAYKDLITTNSQVSVFDAYMYNIQINSCKQLFPNISHHKVYSGREACSLTLNTWKIFGMGIFEKELYLSACKHIMIDIMNSDELLTRELFLNASSVVQSNGKYFYAINENSITMRPSVKHLDLLKNNLYLIDFANRLNLIDKGARTSMLRGAIKEIYKAVKKREFYLQNMPSKEYFFILKTYGFPRYIKYLSPFEWIYNWRYFIKGVFIHSKVYGLELFSTKFKNNQ